MQHAHAKHHFNLDLVSSAGMDGNIDSIKERNNHNEAGYTCFQRQLNIATGTECMHSLGDEGRRLVVPLHVVCAVLSVSASSQSDLQHQAQYSKTLVERQVTSNVCFPFIFKKGVKNL